MGGIASNFVGRDVIILSYAIPLSHFVSISSLLFFPFFFYSTSFTLPVLFFLCFFIFLLFPSVLIYFVNNTVPGVPARSVQSTMITYFSSSQKLKKENGEEK